MLGERTRVRSLNARQTCGLKRMKTHIVLPAAHHHHFCFGAWKESLNEVLLETCVCLACLKQAISVLKHVSACGLGAPTGPSFGQGVADAGGGWNDHDAVVGQGVERAAFVTSAKGPELKSNLAFVPPLNSHPNYLCTASKCVLRWPQKKGEDDCSRARLCLWKRGR